MELIQKKYYRPDEVANFLKVDKRTIYRWVNLGKLAGIKIGQISANGAVRISEDSLEKFLKMNRTDK